jgi:Ni,Fe-hydrogenase III large subunit
VKSQTLEGGDIWARAYLRMLEIENSIAYIRSLIAELASLNEPVQKPANENDLTLAPDSLCVTLAEGWRGEICHCAITNSEGAIIHYKVKDPSLHNWMALALSLRNLEISDFPINNKSYNLSYCGHDL